MGDARSSIRRCIDIRLGSFSGAALSADLFGFLCIKITGMTIAVLADAGQRQDILSRPTRDAVEFVWADSLRSLCIIEADAYMDLEFEPDAERVRRLRRLLPAPVIVNAVVPTSTETDESFIRINAWPGFLGRPVCELALGDRAQEGTVSRIFSELGWEYQLVSDTAGMISPRILAAMVNEAWLTLGRGINTPEEIDRLMQGPSGGGQPPFEWGRTIGLEKIYALLRELARLDPTITIAPLLLKELDIESPDTFY